MIEKLTEGFVDEKDTTGRLKTEERRETGCDSADVVDPTIPKTRFGGMAQDERDKEVEVLIIGGTDV